MKIFITGATGYVGHNLALDIARQDHQVFILVRDLSKKNRIPVHPNITLVKGDLLKPESYREMLEGTDVVYHVGAFVGTYSKPVSTIYKVNVTATMNLLEESHKARVKKFVFTSSCATMGPSLNKPLTEEDPRITGFVNDYEISKHLAELKVMEFAKKGLHTVVVSTSKIFGPGITTADQNFNRVIRNYIVGSPALLPTKKDFIANFVFIDDLVKGHQLAAEKGGSGEKYIIGGYNVSYRQFFDAVKKVSGINGTFITVPYRVALTYASLYFVFKKIRFQKPLFSPKDAKLFYCDKAVSSEKAKKELGYEPVPLDEALRKTINHLRHKYNEELLHTDHGSK